MHDQMQFQTHSEFLLIFLFYLIFFNLVSKLIRILEKSQYKRQSFFQFGKAWEWDDTVH